jgi:hypothetical protein
VIEIPQAVSLAGQLAGRCAGKRIASITAGASPHKFAWSYGDRGELCGSSTARRSLREYGRTTQSPRRILA